MSRGPSQATRERRALSRHNEHMASLLALVAAPSDADILDERDARNRAALEGDVAFAERESATAARGDR